MEASREPSSTRTLPFGPRGPIINLRRRFVWKETPVRWEGLYRLGRWDLRICALSEIKTSESMVIGAI